MLDAELESLGLSDHAVIDVLLQIAGQPRDRYHQIITLILWIVLIVMIHRGAMKVELIGRDVTAQCLEDRRCVHTKFTDEAPHIFGIVQIRNSRGTLIHERFLTKAPG